MKFPPFPGRGCVYPTRAEITAQQRLLAPPWAGGRETGYEEDVGVQRMPAPPFPCSSVHQQLPWSFLSPGEEQGGWGRSCPLLSVCQELSRDPEGWGL